MKEVSTLRRPIAKFKKSIKVTQPTAEDICSLDSAKTKSGLLRGAKEYTNTSTLTITIGMPCATIEPTGGHIWENESHKLINTTHKPADTIFHPLEQLN